MLLILKILIAIVVFALLFLLVLYIIEPSLLALPMSLLFRLFIRNPPFLSMDKEFPEHKILRDNWEVIRDEMRQVLQHRANIPKFHEMDKIQTYISDKDDTPWRVFVFKAYDNWLEPNCAMAPKTAALLRQIPEITSAMFSILEGKKHIPPHYGFYKGVMRYHLALQIPDDAPCYLIDKGEKYQWKEGEDVLFDDTFRHEVRNMSNQTRVVLFCDVYRQESMPGFLKPLNKWVYNMRVKSRRLKNVLGKARVA